MTPPPCIVIDFETHPIRRRPAYPPKPVGVAIRWPGEAAWYWAWAHPTENNCSPSAALEALWEVFQSGLPILCHNAKFDLAVCYETLGLPRLPWDRVHDTMFLAYLCDPHAASLGLKPLTADLLDWPADERDELEGWIWDHRAELESTYGGTVSKKRLGEWIWATPGGLCGRYAIGDVERTAALFDHLWPIVQDNGMGAAYDRERQLLPILMENEEQGIRVDLVGLERDIVAYRSHMDTVEAWLRTELRASGLNFDADRDVASVLLERGAVPADRWTRTKATKAHPNGQLSVSKDALTPDCFTDSRVASALGYRNRLKTCLSMFMEPWQEQAAQRGGVISTNWNQVRGEGGGTRTGRPSTNDPNFLNISKTWDERNDGYLHPDFLAVESLPLVRRYVLPDEGEVILHRDFDGQEMRTFAHFEQGDLCGQYHADPLLDPHAWVKQVILDTTGVDLIRTKVKNTNFARLYGGGIPAVQKKAQCSSLLEAKEIAGFCDRALPGRKVLCEEIQRVVRRGDPIRTWGGRLYYVEPPGFSKKYNKNMNYEYKLINYLVQGSAADLTKQALIEWYNHPARTARFLVTVYDEINISAAPDTADSQMALLRDVMEAPRLAVPMRSSGKRGATWGDLTKCV